MRDRHNRHLNYLRIAVTDRCQLSCPYCRTGLAPHLSRDQVLTFEEIVRAAKLVATQGVGRFRLTGGEPLLRRDLPGLISSLAGLPETSDLSLTTNGLLLGEAARSLADCGLKRVNISLDTLRRQRFRKLTGADALGAVMKGIEAALAADLVPLKINVVLLAGVNEDEIADFAALTFDPRLVVRFIELMPLGESRAWNRDRFLPAARVLEVLGGKGGLEPLTGNGPDRNSAGGAPGPGPARYYRYASRGIIGIIDNVSDCFCEDCNRLRLTARGILKSCLWTDGGVDLKGLFRQGVSDQEILMVIQRAVMARSVGRELDRETVYRMSEIGG